VFAAANDDLQQTAAPPLLLSRRRCGLCERALGRRLAASMSRHHDRKIFDSKYGRYHSQNAILLPAYTLRLGMIAAARSHGQ